MLYRLLNRINHPADLHRLSSEELVELAEEIRHLIISTVERTGGHLGANLGVVELTIALHSVHPPRDPSFDVGHHMPIRSFTGRFHQFATLRQWHDPAPGLLSEHDHFGAGHSSTAISAVRAWHRPT